MKPKELVRKQRLENLLVQYSTNTQPLPGIDITAKRNCLAWQLIDSLRRVEYVQHIRNAQLSPLRLDPTSNLFDPLKAATLLSRRNKIDEAIWLVFLASHFGKHRTDGWALTKGVYGKLGGPGRWDWVSISQRPQAFRPWLQENQGQLRQWRFNNHRKFESLDAISPNGTASVIESYVNWINPHRTHTQLLGAAQNAVGQNPKDVFHYLYSDMSAVKRFGRLGKFDFLTMLDKLGLAPIEADSPYIEDNATGPRLGAQLLFGGNATKKMPPKKLSRYIQELDNTLNVGMQVLEDSLCNWQKSPSVFISFRG